jgi:hypothetical protein
LGAAADYALLSGRSRALGGSLTWFACAFPLTLADDRRGSDADSEVKTAARLVSRTARRTERPQRPHDSTSRTRANGQRGIAEINSVYAAFRALAQGRIVAHRLHMLGTYIGASIVAGLFTLAPGRYLGNLLWHDALGLM